MTEPRFGEVWLAPDGTLLPGGMLCLIVSGDRYNARSENRIIVEVVGEKLAAAGALLVDLGPIGSAMIGSPLTVSVGWFAGADAPVAQLSAEVAAEVANGLRSLLGP